MCGVTFHLTFTLLQRCQDRKTEKFWDVDLFRLRLEYIRTQDMARFISNNELLVFTLNLRCRYSVVRNLIYRNLHEVKQRFNLGHLSKIKTSQMQFFPMCSLFRASTFWWAQNGCIWRVESSQINCTYLTSHLVEFYFVI